MKESLKIKTKKQIYTLLFVLAVIISVSLVLFYYANNSPLDMQYSKHPSMNKGMIQFYTDLDGNGKTEKVIHGANKDSTTYYIAINNDKERILCQYNFKVPINADNIFFDDYNNDNYKDMFVIYKQNDSLFLSVINIKSEEYFIKKNLLLTKPDSARNNFWDINIIFGGLVNLHEFIFAISGAYCLYPRTVYSYNLETKKITYTFPTNASIMEIRLLDLDRDGKKEIIVTSASTGNIRAPSIYNDQTNWFFVLNQKLQPVFSPLNFGSYPSSWFSVKPYLNNGEHYFSITTEIVENGKRVDKIFVINSNGKIVFKKTLPEYVIDHFIIYDDKNKPEIITITSSGNISVYDNSLNLQNNYKTGLEFLRFIKTLKLPDVDNNLVLAQSNNRIILFDEYFNKLSQITLSDIPIQNKYNFSVKKTLHDSKETIFALSKNNIYEISIKKNRYYKYLPFIFLLLTFLIFVLLLMFHKLLSLLSTYTKFFTHQLQHSPNGIVILNSDGELQYSNTKVDEILKITTGLKKGNPYTKIFIPFNEIIKTISKAINTKEKTKGKISYNLPDRIFNGEIVVTPFTSSIGFTYAYLIQVIDHTEPITADRIKIWSSTIQRIAHEIKTPLSGINLGLDTLSYNLERENSKYVKSISLIQKEVDLIKNLTKNFLIFSNMEKPNLSELDLDYLIFESLDVFNTYFTSGIKLKFSPSNYKVAGDFNQLKQLFHVVIENAIDACEGVGEIEIKTVKAEAEGNETVSIGNNDKVGMRNIKTGRIKVIISDTGEGISDEKLSRIFEPYFTTKKDGTGIGLAIAKKIAEDHDGKIEIESELGVGTKVIIYLKTL